MENCSFGFFLFRFEDWEALWAGGGAILVSLFVSWPFSWLFFTSRRYLAVPLLYSFLLLQYSVSESPNCSFLQLLSFPLLFLGVPGVGTLSVEDINGISAFVIVASVDSQRLYRGLVQSLERLFVWFKTRDPAFRDLCTASFSAHTRTEMAGEQRQTISNFPPQTRV